MTKRRCMCLPYLADLHAVATNDCADHFVRHFKLLGNRTTMRSSTTMIAASRYCYKITSVFSVQQITTLSPF